MVPLHSGLRTRLLVKLHLRPKMFTKLEQASTPSLTAGGCDNVVEDCNVLEVLVLRRPAEEPERHV
jgi:hypothetical protein